MSNGFDNNMWFCTIWLGERGPLGMCDLVWRQKLSVMTEVHCEEEVLLVLFQFCKNPDHFCCGNPPTPTAENLLEKIFLMINGLRVLSRASGGKLTFPWGCSEYGMPMVHWNLCLSEALEKPNTHCVIIHTNETPLCGSKLFSEGNHMQIYIFKNPPLMIRETR